MSIDLQLRLYVLLAEVLPVLTLLVSSWLGLRYGARATMMVPLLPIGAFQLAQVAQYRSGGIALVARQATETMWSAMTLTTWVLAWWLVAPRIEARVIDRSRATLATVVCSILLAAAVRAGVVLPLEAAVGANVAWKFVVGLTALIIGFAICMFPTGSEPPAPGGGDVQNIVVRAISFYALLRAPGLLGALEAGWADGLEFLLTSFPRATFELVIGTQAACGVHSARQVLAGLPIGLLPMVAWLVGVNVLPLALDGAATMVGASVLAVFGWIVALYRFWILEKVGPA